MIALAFWNIGKNNAIDNEVADLIFGISSNVSIAGSSGDVILAIAEPGNINEVNIIASLGNLQPSSNWWARWSVGKRFLLISNIQKSALSSFPEKYGCFPNILTRSGSSLKAFPIWFVHLESPQGSRSSAVHGLTEGTELRKSIDEFENSHSSVDTVAIGDFNMTPYDQGMIAPMAINAVPCQSVAKKISRIIKGEKRGYFFNPMWELLGSVTATQQPGSYFKKFRDDSTQWYLIDQAIVRPSMMSKIATGPKILTKAGARSLLAKRNGINTEISDHLPVVLTLNI